MQIAAPAHPARSTDHELVAAVRQGDEAAFEELYRRYHGPVRGYVQRFVGDPEHAEEVAQEAFLSALRRLRASGGPIMFRPWIHEIAKNASIDHFRSRRRRCQEVVLEDHEHMPVAQSASPAPEAIMEGKQALADLQGAMVGLTEAQHRLLVMRELEGLSYSELGERLGMSRSQVESTLFRARRRLVQEYSELSSGARCRRVQGLLGDPGRRVLGARDSRRLERHLAHGDGCRREAHRVESPRVAVVAA